MPQKALVLIEWAVPCSIVGAIIVGTFWVLAFG